MLIIYNWSLFSSFAFHPINETVKDRCPLSCFPEQLRVDVTGYHLSNMFTIKKLKN